MLRSAPELPTAYVAPRLRLYDSTSSCSSINMLHRSSSAVSAHTQLPSSVYCSSHGTTLPCPSSHTCTKPHRLQPTTPASTYTHACLWPPYMGGSRKLRVRHQLLHGGTDGAFVPMGRPPKLKRTFSLFSVRLFSTLLL